MAQGSILVVEDEADIADMLQITFESKGYDVAVAVRGGDALEMCRRRPPNVIVLDIMLPDMDGYDVCRELRDSLRTSHIPIIFLTQRDERADKIRGLELGADDYVTKPFDVEELSLRVQNAMARSRYENLTNPITGLPSGQLIEDRLRQLVRDGDWGIVYLGVRGLDAFGEAYGFVAAEEVLRFVAMVLSETVDRVGTVEDFVGHVGSDEFIVVTEKGKASALSQEIVERFDANVGTHYDWKTREQGYVRVEDEDGNEARVDLMSATAGVITANDGPFSDIREITEAAADARREAVRSEQSS